MPRLRSERCLIGENALTGDPETHPVASVGRRVSSIHAPHPSDAISIGDDVFIEASATIVKGHGTCQDCVVGARAVVKASAPEDVVIAGNPARVVPTPRALGHEGGVQTGYPRGGRLPAEVLQRVTDRGAGVDWGQLVLCVDDGGGPYVWVSTAHH